jgi:hypothetical protein
MNHSEAAIAALYDHEQDLPRRPEHSAPGHDAPERSAPDWGGDEVFSSSPRRRTLHAARQRETVEHALPRPRPSHLARPDRVRSERARPDRVHRPAPRVLSASERAEKLQRLEALERPEIAPRFEPSASGRRTVVVTGHPEPRLAPSRRRPAPTVDQRIGHRPDRIAGWAFGLGLLLILIAILTAH